MVALLRDARVAVQRIGVATGIALQRERGTGVRSRAAAAARTTESARASPAALFSLKPAIRSGVGPPRYSSSRWNATASIAGDSALVSTTMPSRSSGTSTVRDTMPASPPVWSASLRPR